MFLKGEVAATGLRGWLRGYVASAVKAVCGNLRSGYFLKISDWSFGVLI